MMALVFTFVRLQVFYLNCLFRQRKSCELDRLECSLQLVVGETGMRQEVDVRYVVTSLEGSLHRLYENVYCKRDKWRTSSTCTSISWA